MKGNDMFGHDAITVQVRNVYGKDLVYPADGTADLFASLLNVKSFSARQIGTIRELGYTVRVDPSNYGHLPAGY
jgi:hypothetical protein